MGTPSEHHESIPTAKPSIETVWRWLEEVPDPEIPVISVVDLGIVRDIHWRDDKLIVQVTPTYSGCPATRVINTDIEQLLNARGVHELEIQQCLSPAWTTDWINPEAQEKLRQYGIAPPQKRSASSGKRDIACPQCQSLNTECVSQFGSTPCKAAYRCLDCLEPFDYFKCL